MERLREQLTARLVEHIQAMYIEVRPIPTGEWSRIELTMPQLRTLMLLAQGPRRMSDIGDYLGIRFPSATSMVARLANKRLVERKADPDDRRTVICHLTTHGKEVLDGFWRIRRTMIEGLAELLDAAELEAAVHGMEVMHTAVERQRSSSPSKPGPDEARLS